MGLFDTFKKKTLTITVKAPADLSTEALGATLELTFLSPETTVIPSVVVRLRGDLTNRKQAPSAPAYLYFGEAQYGEEIKMAPNQPEKVSVYLPLDFSSLNSYEIPPENMALASQEMQDAAAALGKAVYAYSIEVTAKTDTGATTETRTPITLIDPHGIRTSSF